MSDFVVIDHRRVDRLGFGEAVLCAWKPVAVIEEAIARFREREMPVLLTRLSADQFNALSAEVRNTLDYCHISQTAFFGKPQTLRHTPTVGIVTAGSSDMGPAKEAVRSLAFHGIGCREIYDVGVAGLWRLERKLDVIRACPIVIVAAGMDAALVSVLGGLVPSLIIALPTSVGYGAANEGETALKAILASCAPGIVTVNIDNGYGAALAALRALNTNGDNRGHPYP